MTRPSFKDVAGNGQAWDLLEKVMPDVKGMWGNESDKEEETQQQEQDTDNETDWSSEEESGDTEPDMEREETEVENGEILEETDWNMQDLYHGLVPQELVKGWKKIFQTSTWIAQCMVDRLVSSIEEYGRTEIWKNRCNATIAWEKTVNITATSKKV